MDRVSLHYSGVLGGEGREKEKRYPTFKSSGRD